jgi:DNA-binding CsgD family transcriptional regulator
LLSQLIKYIHDAALDPAVWQRVLERTRGFVGGCAAKFDRPQSSSPGARVLYCTGVAPAYLQLYLREYVTMNPLYPAGAFIEPGEVFSISDLVPVFELAQNRFYNEWMRPQGMVDAVSTNIERSGDGVAALTVLRCERHGLVDDEARRRMRLIAPHVLRSVAIGHAIDRFKAEKAAFADTLGSVAAAVFLVDAMGRIAFANKSAEALLGSGHVVRNAAGRLAASNQEAERALREALAAAGGGEAAIGVCNTAIPLSTLPEQRWLAHVLPLTLGMRLQAGASVSAVAAVLVRKTSFDTTLPLEILAKLYKLTARELSVLHGVIEIGGVPEIAEALGVSEGTVRSHLKSLFDKTGAHRQVDLVKLIAAHASPFVVRAPETPRVGENKPT